MFTSGAQGEEGLLQGGFLGRLLISMECEEVNSLPSPSGSWGSFALSSL